MHRHCPLEHRLKSKGFRHIKYKKLLAFPSLLIGPVKTDAQEFCKRKANLNLSTTVTFTLHPVDSKHTDPLYVKGMIYSTAFTVLSQIMKFWLKYNNSCIITSIIYLADNKSYVSCHRRTVYCLMHLGILLYLMSRYDIKPTKDFMLQSHLGVMKTNHYCTTNKEFTLTSNGNEHNFC